MPTQYYFFPSGFSDLPTDLNIDSFSQQKQLKTLDSGVKRQSKYYTLEIGQITFLLFRLAGNDCLGKICLPPTVFSNGFYVDI